MKHFETATMTEGVGFYIDSQHDNSLPSYDECVEMVRELAYYKWQQAGGVHGCEMDFWLQAERELFGPLCEEGYRLFVCDKAQPCNQKFMRYWNEVKVNQNGATQT